MNNAASETALTEQLEPGGEPARQRSLTSTHDDRPEKQMTLVDQSRDHRLPGELGAADRDVGSRDLLIFLDK
jgi:hypothetical protein